MEPSEEDVKRAEASDALLARLIVVIKEHGSNDPIVNFLAIGGLMAGCNSQLDLFTRARCLYVCKAGYDYAIEELDAHGQSSTN